MGGAVGKGMMLLPACWLLRPELCQRGDLGYYVNHNVLDGLIFPPVLMPPLFMVTCFSVLVGWGLSTHNGDEAFTREIPGTPSACSVLSEFKSLESAPSLLPAFHSAVS